MSSVIPHKPHKAVILSEPVALPTEDVKRSCCFVKEVRVFNTCILRVFPTVALSSSIFTPSESYDGSDATAVLAK